MLIRTLYGYSFQIIAVIIVARCAIPILNSPDLSWISKLTSKVLFVQFTIVAPNCFATILTVFLLGLHFSFEDLLICVFESAIRISALLGFTFVFCMFFSSESAIILGLVAWIIALTISFNFIAITFGLFDQPPYPLFGLSGAISVVVFAPVIAATRYYTRAFVSPVCVFLVTVCITYFVAQSIILEGCLKETVSEQSQDVEAIQAIIPSGDINPVLGFDTRFSAAYVPLQLNGVKSPYAYSARSVRYRVNFTLDNNIKCNEDTIEGDPFNSQELQMLYSEPILRNLVGLNTTKFEESQTTTTRIFTSPILVNGHPLPIANKISGTIYLPFGKLETAKESVDLKDGGSFVFKKFRFYIPKLVDPHVDDIRLYVSEKSIPLALRGEPLLQNEFPGFFFLYRPDNQQDEGEIEEYSSIGYFTDPFCLTNVSKYLLPRPKEIHSAQQWFDWLEHAKITLWQVPMFYWKKVPFEYTNVKLPKEPGRFK